MSTVRASALSVCVLMLFSATTVRAASPTAFTYQGQLKLQGVPVNGEARFSFTLWDAEVDGRQIGSSVDAYLIVVDGLFTASLDFGPDAFMGEPRWLDITVSTAQGGARLSPRQSITPTPVALFAMSGNEGPRGPAGANGLACWDLNGDGVQDREEDVNHDGVLDALDCQGQGGMLALPYAGTNSTDDTAFAVGNLGLGAAASFVTQNAANAEAAVGVLNTGTGPGVMAATSGGGPAIVGATGTAGGIAGSFSVVGTTATQAALDASNEALGSAGHFHTSNTESTADVVSADTNGNGTVIHARSGGTGRAGFFEVDYIGTRSVPGLEVVSNGRGGGAGLFRTTNFLNTTTALTAEAAGNANAIQGTAGGSGAGVLGYNAFGGDGIVGLVEGNAGNAGSFRSTDNTNPDPTLEAVRSGSGSAGRFENSSPGGLAGEFVGDVSVTGSVAADAFRYRTARTFYLSLNAFDFVPNARGLRWEREAGTARVGARIHSDNGQRNYLGAPVHLPDGAVVTGIEMVYNMDSSLLFPVQVSLYRRLMVNGNDSAMATLISPAYTVDGSFSMATTNIASATIDNETTTYWVYVGLQDTCTDDQIGCSPAAVQGVSISYTKDID